MSAALQGFFHSLLYPSENVLQFFETMLALRTGNDPRELHRQGNPGQRKKSTTPDTQTKLRHLVNEIERLLLKKKRGLAFHRPP